MGNAYDPTMAELVNTADSVAVTELVRDVLTDSVLDRRIQERWIAELDQREAREAQAQGRIDFDAFKIRQIAYLNVIKAVRERGATLGWMDINDVYIAQRLFAKNAMWRNSVADADYDRLSALISARA